MPLINGMKMACEPCIRGHRSTKCTHASERLMVPVRKPGRPLSQCPHPRDQSCGCGTVVTAAIPRKQTCGCGSAATPETAVSSQSSSPQSLPQTALTTPIDAPSPTRSNFKVQKPSRPQSSRKQSFDVTNFERMDMNQVNVIPFQQPLVPANIPNGYGFPAYSHNYGYVPQFATMQPQIGHFQMAPPPIPVGYESMVPHTTLMNAYGNGINHQLSESAIESPLATPTAVEPKVAPPTNGTSSCCQPKQPARPVVAIPVAKTGSCCGSKSNGRSGVTSPLPEAIPEEPARASCCATKDTTESTKQTKQEPASTNGTPMMQPQMLMQNTIPYNPAMYQSHYMSQPTVFTYPATYGSFQNPLQPEAWRESMRNNNHIHQQHQQHPIPPQGAIAYEAPLIPGTLDTIHTCSCGDGCSCIGCAAHPYNNETKEYVRSAWDAMNLEAHPEPYTNGNGHHVLENGALNGGLQQNGDYIGSPTANTPSSTTSANGEEQSLSAADFFFVSYPFAGDGCGGDTNSCPCGEDCQCLGCTIHNQDLVSTETLN